MKSILFIALAAILCSCSQKKQNTEHKLITPLHANIAVDNLQDCTIPVAFTPDDFNWMGGNLTMTVYNQDLYDAVEVLQMQVGDTLIYEGKPMIINSIAEEHGGIDINRRTKQEQSGACSDYALQEGGRLEVNGGLDEGGCCLAGFEGGTCVARNWDDHATYTKLGKAEVALADDFVLIDCGEFPDDPNDTIRTGQKLYIENLKDGRKYFFQLNTRATIENGMITEIKRHWIP